MAGVLINLLQHFLDVNLLRLPRGATHHFSEHQIVTADVIHHVLSRQRPVRVLPLPLRHVLRRPATVEKRLRRGRHFPKEGPQPEPQHFRLLDIVMKLNATILAPVLENLQPVTRPEPSLRELGPRHLQRLAIEVYRCAVETGGLRGREIQQFPRHDVHIRLDGRLQEARRDAILAGALTLPSRPVPQARQQVRPREPLHPTRGDLEVPKRGRHSSLRKRNLATVGGNASQSHLFAGLSDLHAQRLLGCVGPRHLPIATRIKLNGLSHLLHRECVWSTASMKSPNRLTPEPFSGHPVLGFRPLSFVQQRPDAFERLRRHVVVEELEFLSENLPKGADDGWVDFALTSTRFFRLREQHPGRRPRQRL